MAKWIARDRDKDMKGKWKKILGNNVQLTTFHIPPARTFILAFILYNFIDFAHAINVGQLEECVLFFIYTPFLDRLVSTGYFRVKYRRKL